MLILLMNLASVLFMTGFIWTMQIVHYPLLDRVGENAFLRYEADHNRLFFRVAGPGVLLTFVSGALLLFARPDGVPLLAAVAGLIFFAIVVVSTVTMQAPQHGKLSRGFDRDAYEFLVKTNWIRTVAWSAYSLLGLWMVWQSIV